MDGYGYNNYQYTQEWEQNQWESFWEPPYQQSLMEYMQYSNAKSMDTKVSSISRLEDSMIEVMQVSISTQESINASFQNITFHVGEITKKLADLQCGVNTQTNPKEHEDSMSIICDEVIDKSTHGETIVVETKGNEIFHQTPPPIAKNVVEEDEKEKQELVEQQEENKQKREKEDKDEIDTVIDSICALFTKVQLEGEWKPHHLYLKFMEFLPNKLKKLDDVLSVSFWPP